MKNQPEREHEPQAQSKPGACYNAAAKLLLRREYSVRELECKLTAKQFNDTEISQALAQLQTQNYQNDARFAEHYTRYRVSRGFGPNKIRQELYQKGITEHDIQLAFTDIDWAMQAEAVRSKKAARMSEPDANLAEAKLKRFLMQRGF